MKKPTTAKLKAHLALAAFVMVSTLMLVLTTVGTLNHVMLATNMQLTRQQIPVLQSLSSVAASSSAAFLPGTR